MPDIRVLQNPARPMQRLGYLKHLLRRVAAFQTSNLSNLGNELINTVTQKFPVKLNTQFATYIKSRLKEQVYQPIKEQTNAWLNSDMRNEPPTILMELQDLYLSDPMMPSQVGKLVKNDWRKYPPLGISLGLIREGTYSANTRALSFLALVPEEELKSFQEYQPNNNPLIINQQQSILLLYCFISNDGEVVVPLWKKLREQKNFTDRDAGDLIPDIYRKIINRHQKRALSADERDRLQILEKSAESILRWKNKSDYAGGAREEASRSRVEPYADIGLYSKPDPAKYEYTFSNIGQVWVDNIPEMDTSEQIGDFLYYSFFSVCAAAWKPISTPLTDPQAVLIHLYQAWNKIKSSSDYAPIEEISLLAGVNALVDSRRIINLSTARDILLAYQKENPYKIRFTVDRLGTLAHVRFMEPFA
jgi:hypothetical protein